MESHRFSVETRDRRVVDLTAEVEDFCRGRGDGLCHVSVPHATAGLALIETGSGSEEDLVEALDSVLPRDDRYRHSHGSRGHGADHLLPAFVSPFLVLAVDEGDVMLGTWQSIVLVDPNRDNPVRTVELRFVAA
jgi:secondary thiamine-phosphate synthase enzyme